MRSGGPTNNSFKGFTKDERKIDATGEVVVLTKINAPVHNGPRFGK